MTIAKLKQGDTIELMATLPDKCVDMILCDLPYGTTYAEFETVLKNMSKFSKKSIIDLDMLWLEYKRVLKPFGTIVLFGAQPFTTTLISSNLEWYKYSWVWKKNKAANHVAIKYQPLKIHEDIIVFSQCGCNTGSLNPIKYNPQGVVWKNNVKTRKTAIKSSGTFKYNSLNAGDYEVKGSNYPTTILEFDIPSGENRFHPTQKPVALCEYLIKTYTNEGMWVLDNTMGSGTTGVACMNTNRNFIGIERDDKYFAIAKQRIEEARQANQQLTK